MSAIHLTVPKIMKTSLLPEELIIRLNVVKLVEVESLNYHISFILLFSLMRFVSQTRCTVGPDQL